MNILITWVSSWIWKYLAENLKNNYSVYGVSRNNPNLENINFYTLDLTRFDKIDEYLKNIENIKFDLVILNAWVGFFDKIENMSDEEIITTLTLNSISPIIFTKKILKNLNNKSMLIFIWSVAGKKFFKYWSVYQSSKFALRWFAWSLKNELKQKVFIINPQYVDTSFFKNERIDIEWKYKETKIETILETVKNIINKKENRFEIDL